MFESVRKVVIPAAGLGTRFLPATKAVPKELLPIVDKPTLQLVVEEAVAAGLAEVVVVNGRHKSAIEDHFDHAYELEDTLERRGKSQLVEQMRSIARLASIVSVRQKQPLGLGHAVLCAKSAVGDEPFAVMLGDDLFEGGARPGIGQLIDVARRTGKAAVALMEVAPADVSLYGIAAAAPDPRLDNCWAVSGFVEKPKVHEAPSRLAIIGRYVLPPDIFGLLERTRPGAGGEIQLTDALDELARAGRLIGVRLQGVRHDAGDRLGYLQANIAYALQRPDLRGPLLDYLRQLVERA